MALGAVNGSFNLEVVLSALERTGNGRVLSMPRVSTQNNVEAEVTQGIQIPIQTVANNTVTVTFKDAALTLRVIPQITAARTVIMRITLENATPDFTRSVNGIPPIDTQRAVTQVQVDDGATMDFQRRHARPTTRQPAAERRSGHQLSGRWAAIAVALCVAASGSCANSALDSGRASTSLVIEQLSAAHGSDTTTFANVLQSDVVTSVPSTVGGQTVQTPTVFEDIAQVIMRLAFNDPGTPANPASPTSANWITVDGYRVQFIRADGRNTPGVDVPYPFDGGVTFSVLDIGAATFAIVRGQAKLEPPLLALRGMGGAVVIPTIAEITFFGHDQTGAQVSAVAGSPSTSRIGALVAGVHLFARRAWPAGSPCVRVP